jgi:hypothetical protein
VRAAAICAGELEANLKRDTLFDLQDQPGNTLVLSQVSLSACYTSRPYKRQMGFCQLRTSREDPMSGAYRHEDFRIFFYRGIVSFFTSADIAEDPEVK